MDTDLKYGLIALMFFLVLLYSGYVFRKKQNRKIAERCPNCNKNLSNGVENGNIICINKKRERKNVSKVYLCEECGTMVIKID